MAQIIIVDDNAKLLVPVMALIKANQHEVQTFDLASEAIEHIKAHPVDLVITDLSMEPLSGLDLLRAVLEHNENIPVIMLTGYATLQTALEARKDGAFDFLTKPFPVKDLLETIRRAMEWRAKKETDALNDESMRGHHLQNYVHSQIPRLGKDKPAG